MTWILAFLCLLVGLILAFVRIKPKDHPPGPWFRLPLLGNSYILFGDATKNVSEMRKRYGDLFSVDITSFRQIMVCDLATLREMLSAEVFSGRGRPMANGIEIFARSTFISQSSAHFPFNLGVRLTSGTTIICDILLSHLAVASVCFVTSLYCKVTAK